VHQVGFHYTDISTVVKILRNTELINNIVKRYEIITALFMKVLPQLLFFFVVLLRHSVEIPSRRTAESGIVRSISTQNANGRTYLCALHNSDP